MKNIEKTEKAVEILLHNIRSVHNVGSMFRTSDALGISKIYLSGYTPSPLDRFNRKRSDLAKVALGAENNVSWTVAEDNIKLIKKLKKEGYKIIAIEQAENSVDYKDIDLEKIDSPVLIIFGNEVEGVDKDMLKLSDIIAEIPMKGKKESLNVSVSFGIALFRILNV